MSSVKLRPLIREFPEEREAVARLARFIETSRRPGKDRFYTFERFFDVAEPSSQRVLLGIVTRLVQQGVLKKLVRVESVAGGGIQDFDSLQDVPERLFDTRQGYEVEVQPEQVRLMFKLPAEP